MQAMYSPDSDRGGKTGLKLVRRNLVTTIVRIHTTLHPYLNASACALADSVRLQYGCTSTRADTVCYSSSPGMLIFRLNHSTLLTGSQFSTSRRHSQFCFASKASLFPFGMHLACLPRVRFTSRTKRRLSSIFYFFPALARSANQWNP